MFSNKSETADSSWQAGLSELDNDSLLTKFGERQRVSHSRPEPVNPGLLLRRRQVPMLFASSVANSFLTTGTRCVLSQPAAEWLMRIMRWKLRATLDGRREMIWVH